MKLVTKYNIFKGISLVCTAGVPLITACSMSDHLVKTKHTSISTAGVIAILIMFLIMKDKILEQVKSPTAFKVCAALLVTLWIIESIIVPIKVLLLITCIALGIDSLIFKQIYTKSEALLGDKVKAYKHFGFICCKTKTILGDDDAK